MENEQFKINKLKDASNWDMWKFQMTVIMNAAEIFDVVNGNSKKPTLAKRSGESEDDARKRYSVDYPLWKRADNKAQKCIVTSVDEQPLQYIMNCDTANDMWNKLLSVYEQVSDTSITIVQQKFYSYTMDIKDNIAGHISKLENLSRQLKQLGEPISESMLITKILMTLPDTYRHFYSAWDSMNSENRTLEKLTARLMVEETRQLQGQEVSDDVAQSSALTAKNYKYNKSQKYVNKNENKKPGKCNHCKKPGHWKRDCRILKKELERKDSTSGLALIGVQRKIEEIDDSDKWFVDSGASDHMTNRREWFVDYETFDVHSPVRIGDGKHIMAVGKGNINIHTFVDNMWIKGYLKNVLYVPDLKVNLFSCGACLDKGITMVTDSQGCKFKLNNRVIAVGVRENKLFSMLIKTDISQEIEHNANVAVQKLTLEHWHKTLCHQNVKHVREYLKHNEIQFTDIQGQFFCEPCIYGKQHKEPFNKSETLTSKPGQIIHSDVCGPMEEYSLGGKRYFVIFKDDYSKYTYVYFLKHKSEVKEKLNCFLSTVKTQTDIVIKTIRSDCGLEYKNSEVQAILKDHGVKHETSVPYNPEQNGKAERTMRTICEAARTMIYAKNFPKSLWAEAVNTAVFTFNCTGNSGKVNKTPHELWFGKHPKSEKFIEFGINAYSLVPKERRKKWDARSRKGYFVGYSETSKGYRIWYKENNEVSLSRDIIFKNESVVNTKYAESSDNLNNNVDVDVSSLHRDNSLEHSNKSEENRVNENQSEPTCEDNITNQEHKQGNGENVNMHNLRDRGNIKKPLRYANSAFFTVESDPVNFKEAVSSQNSEKWIEAMSNEMESLEQNGTWSLVNLPKDRTIVNCGWVYKTKYDVHGNVDRYKARLVAKGYSQKFGIDFNETFSPVVKFDSIRSILAISAAKQLQLRQFDVQTAFLYGDLDEEIYMRQPEGFNDGTEKVCKLHRSLYGLKQSPRSWNKKFKAFLLNFNLLETKADSCVFVNLENNNVLIVAIFVDDGLVAATSSQDINTLIKYLRQHFNITEGELNQFLGTEIEQKSDGSIIMHQGMYCKRILERFNMTDANPVQIPADPQHSLDDKKQITNLTSKVPYREAVGSLLYLSQITRPDITFSVNLVSRYIEDPKEQHWAAVKRIFKYLKGTINFGLIFSSRQKLILKGYSDADYAGDLDTRRSTSGSVFTLGSGSIAWSSRRQQCVSLSTTESEYIALSQGVQELTWLKLFIGELLGEQKMVPTMYGDNQSAIKLVKNPEFHRRTKHIDVRYHYIREKFNEGVFSLEYIPSKEQIADIMTKPTPRKRFQELREMLGIKNVNV